MLRISAGRFGGSIKKPFPTQVVSTSVVTGTSVVTSTDSSNHSTNLMSDGDVILKDTKILRVTIRITEKKENDSLPENVFYKLDESRFRQQFTLKLKTFSKYNINIEVEPYQDLIYVKLGGRRYEKVVKLNSHDGDEKAIYAFIWSTKQIRTTERKHRTVLPCEIKFRQYKEIEFDIMVKFYNNCEIAPYIGKPLSSINLDCTLSNSNESFSVVHNIELTTCAENKSLS